jgi:membrane protease subunit (stomatin/prohibitin family)
MAIVDVIKYNAPNDTVFAWKFPNEDLKLGSQLIVGEGQSAVFVKGGQALDVFDPGTYTLNTGNVPFINKLINVPFGGSTPFTAEVWFVSKLAKRDLKWGTPSPIPIMDPGIGFPVSVRAFGKWGARIFDAKSFLSQLVGSQSDLNDKRIREYFVAEIVQSLSRDLASFMATNGVSVLQVAAFLDQISQSADVSVRKELLRFGVELVNLNIESINIPEEEIKEIQSVYVKSLEVRELSKQNVSGAFNTVKSFEVLNNAASNPAEGAMSAFLGAGLGLGAGLPIGQQLGEKLVTSEHNTEVAQMQNSPVERIKSLKELLDQGLITQSQFEAKRDEILGGI